jgi:hypothetical protein
MQLPPNTFVLRSFVLRSFVLRSFVIQSSFVPSAFVIPPQPLADARGSWRRGALLSHKLRLLREERLRGDDGVEVAREEEFRQVG